MTQRSQTTSTARRVEVKTSFATEALKPGGVTRQSAAGQSKKIENSNSAEAGDIVRAAHDAFRMLFDSCTDGESAADKFPQLIHHTRIMRDLGSMSGYPLVSTIAVMLTDLLEAMREGEIPCSKQVVGCFDDALLLALSKDMKGKRPDQAQELIEGLRAVTIAQLPDIAERAAG